MYSLVRLAYSQLTYSSVGRAGEAADVLHESISYNKSFESFFVSWYQTKVSDTKVIPMLPAAPGPNAAAMDPFMALAYYFITGTLNALVPNEDDDGTTQGTLLFPTLASKTPNALVKYLGSILFVYFLY